MERGWVSSKEPRTDVGPSEGEARVEFTVLQWNILSQTLGINGDFVATPESALAWSHREPLLLQEIQRHEPDVICLEEVDCFPQLSSQLDTVGFAGVWVPKPSSPCLKFKDNMGPDGNAVFFKRSRFELLKSYHRVLNADTEGGTPSSGTLLVCQLEHRATKKRVTVCCTHLKAKKGFEGVRLAQARHALDIIKEEKGERTILAGDFNAGLDESVYMLVKEHGGLESAYNQVLSKEPEYTTWKLRGNAANPSKPLEKKDTIDFIFFDPKTLRSEAVLDLPSAKALGEGLLPNMIFPSDHMSMVAKLSM